MLLSPHQIKNNPLMVLLSFSKIIRSILKELPANDYPVLNSRLFFETWLNFVLDSSLTSMKDLFID
jgi:putative transposase